MAGDWRYITLGDFVALQRGHDLTEPERRIGRVPVMGSAGQNGFHDTALSKGPGIVIGRSGASFGQVHFTKEDFWPHNTGLYVTDFKGNDPIFAFYLLKALDFTYFALKEFDLITLNRGSTQPLLTQTDLKRQSFVLPTNEVVKAFADVSEPIFRQMVSNKKESRTLATLRDTLLPKLLSGEITTDNIRKVQTQ